MRRRATCNLLTWLPQLFHFDEKIHRAEDFIAMDDTLLKMVRWLGSAVAVHAVHGVPF